MTEAIRFYVAVIFNSLSSCLPGNLENRPKIFLEVQRAIKNAQELLLMIHFLNFFFFMPRLSVVRNQKDPTPWSVKPAVSEILSVRLKSGKTTTLRYRMF